MIQLKKRKDVKALAVLDMDGTLLESRSIDVLCQRFGLENKLIEIDRKAGFLKNYRVSELVAQLFKGLKASDLERVFNGIHIVKGAQKLIDFLKNRKFLTALITDSYTFLASRLAEKLDIDLVWGNRLEIVDDLITGRIIMPLGWEKQYRCRKKSVCKLHAMYKIAQKHKIGIDKTLAIGDSIGDYCMIERAAIGVAFKPKDLKIVDVADVVVYGDFLELVAKLKPFLGLLD